MGVYFMKTMIAGSIAVILGLVGFSFFFPSFLTFLAGTVPLLLILGGALTIYLNYESSSQDCTDSQTCQDTTARDNEASLPVKPEKDSSSDTSSKKTDLEGSEPEKQVVNEPKESDDQFIGNSESNVFHNSDCKFSKSKNCTASFNTREKAIQEGYKPCGICKP